MATQPNILMIMADQLTALALPAYGHKVVRAPHLDRLAAEGVLFEQAYCNFPLCAPSRASLMSGRLASRIGVYDNAAEFPPRCRPWRTGCGRWATAPASPARCTSSAPTSCTASRSG